MLRRTLPIVLLLAALVLLVLLPRFLSSSSPEPGPSPRTTGASEAPASGSHDVALTAATAAGHLDQLVERVVTSSADHADDPPSPESTDAEWRRCARWRRNTSVDVIRWLAAGHGSVCTLIRSRQLNPADRYVPPAKREELARLIRRYQQTLRKILAEIQLVRHKELLELHRQGRLPTIEEAATPEQRELARRRIAAADERQRSRASRPETPRIPGGPGARIPRPKSPRERYLQELQDILRNETPYRLWLSVGDQTFLAKDEWCTATRALQSQHHYEFVVTEYGATVIQWFHEERLLSDGQRDRLLSLLMKYVSDRDKRQ